MIRSFPDKPFVAFLGSKNEIEFVQQDGGYVCKSLRGVVLFKQIILLLFGGGLTAGLWFSVRHPDIAHMPMFWTVFVAVFAAICWMILFRNLVGTPRFEISLATGEIHLFLRRTREPSKTIRPSEVSHFTIEKQYYTDDSVQMENAVLVLFLTSGERVVLCGSPDRAVIQSLAEKIAQLTQRPIEERATTKGLAQ